jgi:hypothetical protein
MAGTSFQCARVNPSINHQPLKTYDLIHPVAKVAGTKTCQVTTRGGYPCAPEKAPGPAHVANNQYSPREFSERRQPTWLSNSVAAVNKACFQITFGARPPRAQQASPCQATANSLEVGGCKYIAADEDGRAPYFE